MTTITQEHIHLLTAGAAQLGAQLSTTAVAQLTLYLEELLRWSPKIDLVSQSDPGEIVRKHFLDSLAIAPLLAEKSPLLDLGSGAGFPGLPIAIALPHISVSLLEVRRKRVNFLKEVVRKTKASNITIYEGRAETLARQQNLRQSFSAVLTRATWDMNIFLQLAHPFLRQGGVALAMKGPQLAHELHKLKSSPQTQGFVLARRYRYDLPVSGEHRKIVMFLKEENVSRAT